MGQRAENIRPTPRRPLDWRARGKVMARCYSREADAFICNWCCSRLQAYQVVIDHWMPLALGGQDDDENLCVSCAWCNSVKGSLHPDDAEVKINALLDGALS